MKRKSTACHRQVWKQLTSDRQGYIMITNLSLLMWILVVIFSGILALKLHSGYHAAERKSYLAFYGLEGAMDRLELELERAAGDVVRKAYGSVLVKLYREIDQDGSSVMLDRNEMANELMRSLAEEAFAEDGEWKTELSSMIKEADSEGVQIKLGTVDRNIKKTIYIEETGSELTEQRLYLRNCMVTDKKSGMTITADFCIAIPYVYFVPEESPEDKAEKRVNGNLVRRTNWRKERRSGYEKE